jgi:hypothetical protein
VTSNDQAALEWRFVAPDGEVRGLWSCASFRQRRNGVGYARELAVEHEPGPDPLPAKLGRPPNPQTVASDAIILCGILRRPKGESVSWATRQLAKYDRMVMGIARMSRSLISSRSVPRGSHLRIRPLAFSTPPFCQLA